MTGTQSLSFMQLQTITDEVGRLEIAARRDPRNRARSDASTDAKVGEPVTIVIHQPEKAWVQRPLFNAKGGSQYGSKVFTNVPEGTEGADKRVQIHRAFADSVTFWIDRDGNILHRI